MYAIERRKFKETDYAISKSDPSKIRDFRPEIAKRFPLTGLNLNLPSLYSNLKSNRYKTFNLSRIKHNIIEIVRFSSEARPSFKEEGEVKGCRFPRSRNTENSSSLAARLEILIVSRSRLVLRMTRWPFFLSLLWFFVRTDSPTDFYQLLLANYRTDGNFVF